jgi:hypothetical protein
MDNLPQKIGIRELGKMFGWSPAKTKEILSQNSACKPDGTPSHKWASEVVPKFIVCQYSGSPVVKYLWPRQSILEFLFKKGYTILGKEERKRKINSWLQIDKPIHAVINAIYNRVTPSEKESALLQYYSIQCSRDAPRWSLYSRSNIKSMSQEIKTFFEGLLHERIHNQELISLIIDDMEVRKSFDELANFMERQRFRKLSKEIRRWV